MALLWYLCLLQLAIIARAYLVMNMLLSTFNSRLSFCELCRLLWQSLLHWTLCVPITTMTPAKMICILSVSVNHLCPHNKPRHRFLLPAVSSCNVLLYTLDDTWQHSVSSTTTMEDEVPQVSYSLFIWVHIMTCIYLVSLFSCINK